MNFIGHKKMVVFGFFVIFIFFGKTFFGMNEEVKKEIKFFWDKKTPWVKSVESTIECDISLLNETKFPGNKNLSLEKYEYKFFSNMYPIEGSYMQKKVFLKNTKTGHKIVLKSFEDCGKYFLIENFDGKKEFIDKNDGHVICE